MSKQNRASMSITVSQRMNGQLAPVFKFGPGIVHEYIIRHVTALGSCDQTVASSSVSAIWFYLVDSLAVTSFTNVHWIVSDATDGVNWIIFTFGYSYNS